VISPDAGGRATDSPIALDGLVRWSRRVGSGDEAAQAVTDAFASFRGARPRPVHLEIPVDVLEQEWHGTVRTAPDAAPPVADPELVRRAAAVLSGAARLLVITGGGAVDASAEVTTLIEELGAPVASTVDGKGVVDDGHPLAVGSVRLRAVQEEAAACDALLVVGSGLADADLGDERLAGTAVIRVDVEEGQLHKNCHADVALLGDAAATLRAVLDALPSRHAIMGVARAAALRAACRTEARAAGGAYEVINDYVRAALPADGVLAGDSRVASLGSVHFFPMPAPRRFCCVPGSVAPGYGLPAGIGASVARPGHPTVVLLGADAFPSAVPELATAVALELPLPVVVIGNGEDGQQAVSDIASLATGRGAYGARTSDADDLGELVADALEADRPTVIHLDPTS
jgi:thiamine pyrophosphate-dependent acetolactate synthase large subunit-like protein